MEVFRNDGTVVTAWVLETLCWLFMWWNLCLRNDPVSRHLTSIRLITWVLNVHTGEIFQSWLRSEEQARPTLTNSPKEI